MSDAQEPLNVRESASLNSIFSTSDRAKQTLAGKQDIPFRYAGIVILCIIVGLTVLSGIAFVVFASMSYPSPGSISALLPDASAEERAKAYVEIQAAWVDQVTKLGQLFVFGSLVPLLGTVVGYVLGARSSTPSA